LTRLDPGASHSSPRAAPSIHVRAALTWLAIFPLVAIGITAMAPFTGGWDPVLRAFVLTLVVVPLAVYLVLPWLMSTYDRILALVGRRNEGPLEARPPNHHARARNRKDRSRCR
jgi:antibiotic biosynthesis monooxygenase (ABM) superfamily enzyme